MSDYLKSLQASLPAPPQAILVVSGHWLEPAFSVTSGPRPELIFDYYGFPSHTYALHYDAPGSPTLAARVVERLEQAGLRRVRRLAGRRRGGLDRGPAGAAGDSSGQRDFSDRVMETTLSAFRFG